MSPRWVLASVCAVFGAGCVGTEEPVAAPPSEERLRRYQTDLELLQAHVEVVELADEAGLSRVAIVPAYQGRVMTSTASGPDGYSLGWINEELIRSGETLAHINPYGGEDRFWLGPEGGQYAIFFEEGAPFDLESWQTPPLIDTEPFELVEADGGQAVFTRRNSLTNRAGFTFELQIDRTVRLLDAGEAEARLGSSLPPGVAFVAFETSNLVTNVGDEAWRKDTGLLSIWILGMFPPSPGATVAIPFVPGPEDELGPVVNDAYFGQVPEDRLAVSDGVVFFKADGQYRSKIGIPPKRARPVSGSYDPDRELLTLVWATIPEGATEYVNSMWEMQEEPFAGDVINSYNDGPPAPGAKPLGPFYELESSSPALELQPGESHEHVHMTLHLWGSQEDMNPLAQAVLGVEIGEIQGRFGD